MCYLRDYSARHYTLHLMVVKISVVANAARVYNTETLPNYVPEGF